MLRHLPIRDPQPDAGRFVDILMGRRTGPPPLVEYIVDTTVLKPIVTELLGREWVGEPSGPHLMKAWLDNYIAFWLALGYDFVRLEIGLPFEERRILHDDVVDHSNHQRAWNDQHQGIITSWEDFERYEWPSLEDVDLFPLDYVNENLPEGMGLVTCHAAGVFEHVSQLMSIETLCIAACEQPDLVAAVFDKVGTLLLAYYERLFELDRLCAVLQGDDMGFRTGTLIAPDDMRRYALPWHKKLAQRTHKAGVPYFLHSCGNLDAIMDNLIDDAGIDGKHSFEDAIIPVEDFQARYGDRIAVLGGVDINRLSAGTPGEVRAHTRYLIETCGPRGRYAIGSGNSIPSYVPAENYLAMLDEAHDVNG
ncbi:MAG TPA: uroporphyrinogen decarboxylase family protein [Candidatus Hydrogenedentes bacterium]|jgi:uroporphyrinogen decarboxylase|nr:uroporphyrinogen decarboxylase family protein [Candidatus Hydrogenedentota bacterium]